MAIDTTQIAGFIFPLVKTILMTGLGLGSCVGLAYYLFVVKLRRTWNVNIWEKKADGRLQMVSKDIILEKKINKGKQLIYRLKRARTEVFPPSWESVYRVRNKEYCDYLRIMDDFIPLKRELKGVSNLPAEKEKIGNKVKAALRSIKFKTKEEINKDYIMLPISQSMTANISFSPMDYDVNMMRINAIDIRDKIYADKKSFLEKYGTFIAFGLIVVLIIVVLYMSYEYSSNVLQASYGQGQATLNAVEQLANKMGGTPPPQ